MTLQEKVYDLSAIWRHCAFVFPHFHRCGVNWDEAYREYIPRALATETDREHALLMMEFVNLLGDGHTDISLNREITDRIGYFPFPLDFAEGEYHIQGEKVLHIDGIPMDELVERAKRYVYHVGGFLPRLRYILLLLLPDGEHSLETEQGIRKFSFLKERPQTVQQQEADFFLHGDILRIRLDDFLRDRSGQVREKLLEVKPRGVILDIRENIGGMTKFGADMAQLFISGTFGGCKKWTRKMTGVGYASAIQVINMDPAQLEAISGKADREEIEKSRRIVQLADFEEYEDCWGQEGVQAVFDGPLVLLTSRRTVSAAEDFTAFFRSNGRGTILGAPTCGTSGTPLLKGLYCGTLRVCSVGYTLRDGTAFLGRGIQPDIRVEPSGEELLNQRDPVLQRALKYLT